MPLYEITGEVQSANPEVTKGNTVRLSEANGRPLVEAGLALEVAPDPAPTAAPKGRKR